MKQKESGLAQNEDDRVAKISNAEDAAFMLERAESVIIVPVASLMVWQLPNLSMQ